MRDPEPKWLEIKELIKPYPGTRFYPSEHRCKLGYTYFNLCLPEGRYGPMWFSDTPRKLHRRVKLYLEMRKKE